MSSVYEPHEDSELLARVVAAHARGTVLDIGTGSGIQAFAALQRHDVTAVTCVDINPAAAAHVQVRIDRLPATERQRISVLQGDMFAPVAKERFDTIICNPPYLPDEEKDHDPALYGGPEGSEFTMRLLQEVGDHLAPGGQLLLLFSSLTNRDRIDLELKRLGYHHAELAQLAQFFERLYVYRVWRD
jgi:release factor glutamine methyltransferase